MTALLETPVAHPPRWDADGGPSCQTIRACGAGYAATSTCPVRPDRDRRGITRYRPPPAPPKWRALVLVFGLLISFMLLAGLRQTRNHTSFTYSAFHRSGASRSGGHRVHR